MRRLCHLVALAASIAIAAGADGGNVDLPRHPAVSPDGDEITYSWRGDIWKAPIGGGESVRLTAHPSVDSRSAWSPDGTMIAFESERDGASNLFVMRADGTDVQQVTFTDRPCVLSAFSSDGTSLLFESSREGDVYRDTRLYRVHVDGGPIARLMDCFGSHAVDSPDGSLVAFERGGSSWTRRHYRGPDDRDVWAFDVRAGTFSQVTDWIGNDGMARWRDGRTLVFASDREMETVNLYEMRIGEPNQVRRLTSFDGRDVWEFDVSRDGRRAVILVWDTLYSLDLTGRAAEPVAIDLNASADSSDGIALKSVSDQTNEARLSPDGKAMAVVAYGEVFVRGLEDDSPTVRVTNSHAREHDIAWSPDGATLYFVSDADGTDSIYGATVAQTRGDLKKALEPEKAPAVEEAAEPTEDADADSGAEEGGEDVDGDDEPEGDGADTENDAKMKDDVKHGERWADAIRVDISPVVQSSFNDSRPMPSPDGTALAFLRTRGDLMLRDLRTGEERLYSASWDQWRDVAWSPDGRYLAWSVNDRDFNSDVWIAPVGDAGGAVNISRHPDNDYSPRWSADGKVLAFLSDRQNNEADVWMVFLDRDMDSMSARAMREYFKSAGEAAKKREPLKIGDGKDEASDTGEPAEEVDVASLDLDDAYLRLRRVTSHPGSESGLLIAPSGERVIFSRANPDGGMVSVKWDGSEEKKLGDSGSLQQVSLTGDKVVFVRNGRASTTGPEGGETKTFSVSQTLRIDLAAQSKQKFGEAARILGTSFYHPTMKGLDWDGLTKRYGELAARAHTSDEFDAIAAYFIGELNGSHLGVYSPGDSAPAAQANGRLGIDVEPAAGGWRVTRVLPMGPGDNGNMSLIAGDVIKAINFEPVSPDKSIESYLKGLIDDEVVVAVDRADENGVVGEVVLLLRPTSYGAENNMRYDDWQRRNAAQVAEWSDGRIGYLHIRSMGAESLVEYERDLYAAAHGKEGLLIDVRNNGGGWTADLVMASLTYQQHAYTIPRGADADEPAGYPRDRLFIQSYTGPANMLCNEKSFSNAEIVSHAFKTVGRGHLVGQQTYGGVISTGGTTLIDGTWVRIPFRGWYLPDGTDMENHGAMPDVVVPQTPEDESAGYDRQLRAAVDDLLQRLP
ncbi:MAG: PD40 domain-containing protein [Phycisphaerales bacterium]|nr:PD40 domain-containing protein [Phycisphaerales bacterium]